MSMTMSHVVLTGTLGMVEGMGAALGTETLLAREEGGKLREGG